MSRRARPRHCLRTFEERQLERIASALEQIVPKPIWERGIAIEEISKVIYEFDKQRSRPPLEIPPLSSTEREVLAQRIFERIFKEE